MKREAWTVRDQKITDTFYLSILSPQSVTNGLLDLSVPNPTAKGGLLSKEQRRYETRVIQFNKEYLRGISLRRERVGDELGK